jgi:hypothetical protein
MVPGYSLWEGTVKWKGIWGNEVFLIDPDNLESVDKAETSSFNITNSKRLITCT